MKLVDAVSSMRLVLLVALCAVFSAKAGEPPPPAEQPDDKKLTSEEAVFTFDPAERRDPFTFTKAVVVVAPTAPDATHDTAPTKPMLRPHEVEAIRKKAEDCYLDAERTFMDAEALGAVGKCDRGLEVFKDISNISEYPPLQQVRENLIRLRKASERVRQRQDAEREFGRLNIKVTGVVAREKRSQAIINGSIVSRGDLVITSAETNDAVVVDEILPEQVVFVFRGYKMTLGLSEIGR